MHPVAVNFGTISFEIVLHKFYNCNVYLSVGRLLYSIQHRTRLFYEIATANTKYILLYTLTLYTYIALFLVYHRHRIK